MNGITYRIQNDSEPLCVQPSPNHTFTIPPKQKTEQKSNIIIENSPFINEKKEPKSQYDSLISEKPKRFFASPKKLNSQNSPTKKIKTYSPGHKFKMDGN